MLALRQKIRRETDAVLRQEYDRREKQLQDQIENICGRKLTTLTARSPTV
jgi:hypothetical protein